MIADAVFFNKLSRLRLAMGHKASMNLTGNRKSVQKGSSTEFSDFREYMPGDDIRRIDWNAYGRLDRLYVKEYMEEKEMAVSVLLDTSASMDYGKKKKRELACLLAAAISYMGLNHMDRVILYDMQKMQSPFMARGGKKVLPVLTEWLEQRHFDNAVDISEAVRQLPMKGPGVTILISDFLQDIFMEESGENITRLLRFLDYRKQKVVCLHVLAGEELSVWSYEELTGTRNLIDMEDKSTLRLTLDDGSIKVYEKALQEYLARLKRECAKMGAVHAVCCTETDIYQLIFQDLRMLYDI
ncbi:MAG: DUF58 domain-containing protein [Lachnospiraceae bacterium]|nr:DUF58 domain-containing protein [Lachnospiraceae bacterium]